VSAPQNQDFLREDFQDYGGDVVVGSDAVGEGLEAVEEVIEGFGGRLGLALGPEFGQAISMP